MNSKIKKIESFIKSAGDLPLYVTQCTLNDPQADLSNKEVITPNSSDYQTTKNFYTNFYKVIIDYEIRS